MAVIPLDDSSDEECGIPKPAKDIPGRPKYALIHKMKKSAFSFFLPRSSAVTRSFNMDRLKEVERQRQQTAATFDDQVEV